MFLHPLAIADPSHVVELFTHDTRTIATGNNNLTPSSIQNFEDYRERNSVFSQLAAYFIFGLPWQHDGQLENLPAMMTSSNYFETLGVTPLHGRFFSADEDIKQAAPVVVLSYTVWRDKFASNPGAIGQTMSLNNIAFSIIGVTPPGFKGTQSLNGTDFLWVPFGMRDQLTTGQLKALSGNRRFRWINMVGHLKPGVSTAQATSAVKTIALALEK